MASCEFDFNQHVAAAVPKIVVLKLPDTSYRSLVTVLDFVLGKKSF